MGILATIIVGLLAGWLAGLILKIDTSFWVTMLLGIAGSIIAGWITSLILGVDLTTGLNLTTILASTLGAVLVVFLYRLFKRK